MIWNDLNRLCIHWTHRNRRVLETQSSAMPLCSARKATVPLLKMARASCQCSEPQLGSISQGPSQTGDFVAVQLELQQKLLQNWSKNRMSSHVIACHLELAKLAYFWKLWEICVPAVSKRRTQVLAAWLMRAESASAVLVVSSTASRQPRSTIWSQTGPIWMLCNWFSNPILSDPFRCFRFKSFHLDAANGTCLNSGSHLALGNIWLIAPSSPCAQQPGSSASGLSNVKCLCRINRAQIPQLAAAKDTFPDTSSATAWETKRNEVRWWRWNNVKQQPFAPWPQHVLTLAKASKGCQWPNTLRQLPWLFPSCHTFEHRDKLQIAAT